MQRAPLVSIVIPVYNGSRFLAEAIHSALAQTYARTEVIVVNDGSNDEGRTEEVALSFGQRVRYCSKPNGGVSSALNEGIRHMRGDFFSWLSHDDVYYPTKVEEQVLYLQSHKDGAQIVFSDFTIIDEHSGIVEDIRYNHAMLSRAPLYGVLRLCIHGCSLLIPKRCFLEAGLFDENLATTGDYDLWFRFAQRYRLAHIPRPLIYSRSHDMQDSKNHPGHQAACDDLMLRMMRALSRKQILSCEPSAHAFYSGMARFLPAASFPKASELVAQRARRSIVLKYPELLLTTSAAWTSRSIRTLRRGPCYAALRIAYNRVCHIMNPSPPA